MAVTRVSLANNGAQSDEFTAVSDYSISADGRFVAWLSSGTNLVDEPLPDTGSQFSEHYWYVRDTVLNTTHRITFEQTGFTPDQFDAYDLELDQFGGGAITAFGSFGATVTPTGAVTQAVTSPGFGMGHTVDALGDGSGFIVTGDTGEIEYFEEGPGFDDDIVSVSVVTDQGTVLSGIELDNEVFPSFVQGQSSVYFSIQPFVLNGASNADFAVARLDLSLQGATIISANRTTAGVGGNLSSDLIVVDLKSGNIDQITANNAAAVDTVLADKESFVSGVGNDNRIVFDPVNDDLQSGSADISADGRYLVYATSAERFGGGNDVDIVLFDRVSRTETLVSQVDGVSTSGNALFPSISGDGRFVTFWAEEDGFAGTDSQWNIFVWDRLVDELQAVNIGTDGLTHFASSRAPEISADGSTILFHSTSDVFVEGDTNNRADVFAADNPFLLGLAANDILEGNGGSDNLQGGLGDDYIYGDGFQVRYALSEANQVFRLYHTTFNRTPDDAGHKRWTGELLTGESTLAQVREGFVGSQEFQNEYGAVDDQAFVKQLYINVLDRDFARGEVSQAEINNWTGRISDTFTRADVVNGFAESQQLINNTTQAANALAVESNPAIWSDDVYRLYRATLDREPDSGGFAAWAENLSSGQSLISVISGFTNSQEFNNVYGLLADDEDFVKLLYNNVLDRDFSQNEVTQSEIDGWTSQLSVNFTRANIVNGFSQSQEFVQNTAADVKAYIRGLGTDDIIDGGSGVNTLAGGSLADQFVFRQSEASTDIVLDLEAWDYLSFDGFGYGSANDVRSHITQGQTGAVFADQGTSVTFVGFQRSDLSDDMIIL